MKRLFNNGLKVIASLLVVFSQLNVLAVNADDHNSYQQKYTLRIDISSTYNYGCGEGRYDYTFEDQLESAINFDLDNNTIVPGSFISKYAVPQNIKYKVIGAKYTHEQSNLTVVCIVGAETAVVAKSDTYTTSEDTQLDGSSVLANDNYNTINGLSVVLVGDVTHGTLTLNADGTFTYVPNANFNGTDSFTYKVFDGTYYSNTVTVTINVASANDAPVAIDDSYTTNEDTTLSIAASGVLSNDTDLENNALSAIKASDPSHGTVTLNTNGSFTYIPDSNYFGSDSFTYMASDGLDSDTATVTITINNVNDAPVATVDTYTTNEDTTLNVAASGVLSNDESIDLDALSAILVSGVSHGTLTLNSDGSFSYKPDDNYNGSDSFTYKANDGTDSNVVTVNITIGSINDAPVAIDDAYSTDEDTTLTINASGVLSNDTDVENSTLSSVLVSGVSHGSLTLNGDGSLSYTPEANYVGEDSFTYKANDGLNSNVATVTITINPINDAPVATPQELSTEEDTSMDITLAGTDIENDPLSPTIVGGPTHGTLTLNDDGSYTYTPDADYIGDDSFQFIVNDGSLDSKPVTVVIHVTPVNDAPVATPQELSTDEDTTLNITLAGKDVENDPLSYTIVGNPTHGTLTLNEDGTFTYTPDADYVGDDSFQFFANDGSLDSKPVTVVIHVTPVNDLPVAYADAYTTTEDTLLSVAASGILGNDTDVDGTDTLRAVLDVNVVNGSLTLYPDGSFTYLPNANFSGSDAFTYHVNDGTGNSNTVIVNITVTPVNDAPVAVADTYTMTLGSTLTIASSGILSNDSDVESSALSSVLNTDVNSGSLTLGTDGSFVYTAVATGNYSFTYHVNDGELDSNVVAVTINVIAAPIAPVPSAPVTPIVTVPTTPTPLAGLNTAPIANTGSFQTTEGSEISGQVNATDPQGDAMTYRLTVAPTHGTITFNEDGTFTYTPDEGFVGTDRFSFVANDGSLDSNESSITLNVDAQTVTVDTTETPLAALPMDFSWLFWLLGLLPLLLAFLRPNIKYIFTTEDGKTKTLRRRLSKPSDDQSTFIIDLDDKGLANISSVDVNIYKRLAKHLGDLTVNFMVRDRLVQSVVIPEGQAEKFLTTIKL